MGALAAGVLNDDAVAPDALRRRIDVRAGMAEHDVARDLDAGQTRVGLAFVELGACELAAVACNAEVRVADEDALGGLKHDVGRTPLAARAWFIMPIAAMTDVALRKPRRVKSCGRLSLDKKS
ncbi:MAG: hypothetical protein ACLUNV_05005 [Sutterella wadsworthensis]